MMCEIFREIFGQWQVGFIGGRHELQINRVAGGLKTTIPYTVDSRNSNSKRRIGYWTKVQ